MNQQQQKKKHVMSEDSKEHKTSTCQELLCVTTQGENEEACLPFLSFRFFHLQQPLVLFVKRVAEHLLSWPPFICPSRRVYVCVCLCDSETQICVCECTFACACECVCWDIGLCSCWGSPPDGCPLFPLSLSLCVSRSLPAGLWAFPFFSAHTAAKFMSLNTGLSQGIDWAG